MSRVRRNAEGFLKTEQWKYRSYATAKRRLSLVYCYVQGGLTQWWSGQKVPMCLCCIWPFPVPLIPVCSRNAVLRHAQGWLTLVNWLLLSGKMFVRLSLVFIHSPDVTQLVLLLVKANSSPWRLSSQTMMQNKNTELSQSWDLSDDLFRGIEKVTCSFYSSGANASDVNDHRYNHFFAKNGEIESHQLPSCKDCLQRTPRGQTIKRVFGGAV